MPVDSRTVGYVSRLAVLGLLACWFASIGWVLTAFFILFLLGLSL